MAIAKFLRLLAWVPLLAGLCGCGLLGVGSTVGAVAGIMSATSQPEIEYVYPPEPDIVLGTVAQAGIAGGRITAFGQAGASPLFAGTYRAGIWRWDTTGPTWVQAGTGFNRNLTVSAVAPDPLDATRVLAGTGKGYAGGIWLSENGGANWAFSSVGLASMDVRCFLAQGSTAPSVFFAGTAAGLFRSNDGGHTWLALGTTGLYNLSVSGIAADATNLYISTLGGGVYASADAGLTWTQCSSGLTDLKVTALVLGSSTLYAGTETQGVFKSVDAGATWALTGVPNPLADPQVLCLALDPNDPNRCWAGTPGGLQVTVNGGNTWLDTAGTDPTDLRIESLYVAPASPADTVYAGGFSGGVFRSVNATTGGDFAALNTGLIATEVRALAADLVTPGRYYAGGGFDSAGETSSGIFVSADSGATWTPPASQPPGGDIRAFAPHTTTAGHAYAAVKGAGVWFTSNGGGIWTQVWTPVNLDTVSLVFLTNAPGDTLLAGCLAGGVCRTVDGGTTWTAATGLPVGVSVHDLSLEPGSATNVWAATSDGVYFSANSGQTWTKTAGQPSVPGTGGTPVAVEPLCIQVDPDPAVVPVVVYAGTEANGIFASTDGALTFHPSNQHVEGAANVRVFDFCARAAAPYRVYAATNVGLYRSASKGEDWSPIHDGDIQIADPAKRRTLVGRALALDPSNPADLFVGTGGRGVLRITLQVP